MCAQIQIRKVLSNTQLLNKYLEERIRTLVREIIETMLEVEISEVLNRRKYERLKEGQSGRGYRNGYRNRYLLTIYCTMLQIKIPRCRGLSYRPLLFRKKGILEPALEEMLLLLWSDGDSYRDIHNFVRKIYGTEISLGFLSRMVQKIDEKVRQFHNREIEYHYDCIYIDGLEICIKEYPSRLRNNYCNTNKIGKNSVVLVALGQRKEKEKIIREIIDYHIVDTENEKTYTEFFRSLKARGLTSDKIGIMVSDGLDGISLGIKNIYGKNNIPQQNCMFHKLVNITKTVQDKNNERELRKDIWSVYSSKTKKEYCTKKTKIIDKWVDREPIAIKMFCISDDRLKTKYDFRVEMHKSIQTNNPIERYFKELRRRIKAMGIFETKLSADLTLS